MVLVYVYVKIHAQRDELEAVYQIGERRCSEHCYCRGEKKNSLFISIYVGDYKKVQNIIIAFQGK